MHRQALRSKSGISPSESPTARPPPEPARAEPLRPAPPPKVEPTGVQAPALERPAGRRYAGFPGVGATQVAPDVILFAPRRTPLGSVGTASVGSPAAEMPDVPSPERRAVLPDQETPEEERLCMRSWAVCAAAMAPVVFSTWMLLLPFVFRGNGTVVRLPPLPAQPSATSPGPAGPTLAKPSPTTQSSKSSTPTIDCNIGPEVKDVLQPFNATVYRVSASLGESTPSELMCLFNNTRVNAWTGQAKYYSVQSLPLQICSTLVYWSVGFRDGRMLSRMPVFDKNHGMHRLRRITDRLASADMKILLALGGYPEDGPQFTATGRDPSTLDSLTAHVLATVKQLRLNGVALHWMQPHPGCRSGDDRLAFTRVVSGFRKAFAQGAEPERRIVSVITDSEPVSIEYAVKVAHAVDYIFVFAYRMPQRLPEPFRLCEQFTEQTSATLHAFVRVGTVKAGVKTGTLCLVESVAPVTARAVWDPVAKETRLPSEGSLYGPLPFHTDCNKPSFCKDARSNTCIVHRVGEEAQTLFYLVPSLEQYNARFNFTTLGLGSGSACVLMADFDFDNYDGVCGAPFVRYMLVRNLHYGTQSASRKPLYGLYRQPDCRY
ncbi:uncharacterized protein [Dermacentor albipictus]|uniref:uncharacterized protein isoform X2 n=1 Tax=Dermacentor albipictus TaxID=60249 RepID=UPI0031FD6C9F